MKRDLELRDFKRLLISNVPQIRSLPASEVSSRLSTCKLFCCAFSSFGVCVRVCCCVCSATCQVTAQDQQGWLHKQGSSKISAWKKRYFVLQVCLSLRACLSFFCLCWCVCVPVSSCRSFVCVSVLVCQYVCVCACACCVSTHTPSYNPPPASH